MFKEWEDIVEKQVDDAEEIKANGELLEFTPNPSKNLDLIKSDLALLTNVWETAHKIEIALTNWKQILWSQVDFAQLSNECEGYNKTIRKIEKHAKEWNVYAGLENLINSVSSTIPILEQLHNDKFRPRHWSKLH